MFFSHILTLTALSGVAFAAAVRRDVSTIVPVRTSLSLACSSLPRLTSLQSSVQLYVYRTSAQPFAPLGTVAADGSITPGTDDPAVFSLEAATDSSSPNARALLQLSSAEGACTLGSGEPLSCASSAATTLLGVPNYYIYDSNGNPSFQLFYRNTSSSLWGPTTGVAGNIWTQTDADTSVTGHITVFAFEAGAF